MRLLTIIPAKLDSKRLTKKNIRDLNGKPLLEYTIKEVKKSKFIDKYVVGTDDEDIKLVCDKNDVNVINRKPVKDTQTTAEGLLEILNQLPKYDYVIEIMCTNPLKTVEDIDEVIYKLHSTKATSVVSVVRIWDNHPSRIKYIENDVLVGLDSRENPDIPGQRRQDLTPAAYVRNGSIYAMTYNQITIDKCRIGNVTRPYIMPGSRTINIDEPRDLMLAKFIIENENN